jgi:hypothetical protein
MSDRDNPNTESDETAEITPRKTPQGIMIGEPYNEMLIELREAHGDEIDTHIRDLIKDAIHESYKELDHIE